MLRDRVRLLTFLAVGGVACTQSPRGGSPIDTRGVGRLELLGSELKFDIVVEPEGASSVEEEPNDPRGHDALQILTGPEQADLRRVVAHERNGDTLVVDARKVEGAKVTVLGSVRGLRDLIIEGATGRLDVDPEATTIERIQMRGGELRTDIRGAAQLSLVLEEKARFRGQVEVPSLEIKATSGSLVQLSGSTSSVAADLEDAKAQFLLGRDLVDIQARTSTVDYVCAEGMLKIRAYEGSLIRQSVKCRSTDHDVRMDMSSTIELLR
ncbi:MAG: hypothetical protein HC923_05060 [Myxococcales bacterium]|nr:hypothetical protein [Myxococcales bacterium]